MKKQVDVCMYDAANFISWTGAALTRVAWRLREIPHSRPHLRG